MRGGSIWHRLLPWALLGVAIAGAWLPMRVAKAAEMLHNIAAQRAARLFEAGGKYRFPCPVFGTCNHRIVGLFQVRRAGTPETWVVAAIPNEEACHACTSRMTLEVYRKRHGKWRKHRVWRHFDEWGTWGRVSPGWVRMARVDDGRMMLFLHLPFLQMGEQTETMRVYIVDDRGVSPAGDFCLTYDNEGAVLPGSGMKVIKWDADYELASYDGRPKLVFRITGDAGLATNTVAYEIQGRGLRLSSPPDLRLNTPCGAHLYR